MKTIILWFCLLFCIKAYAVLTRYPDIRDFVEKHNPNDQTPVKNRVFVEFNWKDSVIVHYHDGMKLDDAIRQTKFEFKEKVISTFVFRDIDKLGAQKEPVYDSRFTKIKSADFVLQPLDAIDLTDQDMN